LQFRAWCFVFGICGAALNTNAQNLRQGIWHASLQLNDSISLPFQFEAKEKAIEIINAEERIVINEIEYIGDSVFIQMPVFDSEIRCRIKGDSLTGNFLNHARTIKNIVPFKAAYGKYIPFVNSFEIKNFKGRWEAEFASDDPPLNKAVGEFKQNGNYISGTFLTPTGDYRYLEGNVDGNNMYLSCFDGSHLFYFNATMKDDGTIQGHYYSGKHWHDTWIGKRNEKAELPNPDSLTFLKSGYDKLNFTFPDADSNLISLSDKRFQNKVVVVQIMGTWCPNCMDETAYLAPYYRQYRNKGFEIIALDYEKLPTLQTAKHNLKRLKEKFQIEYALLFAGSADKAIASMTLPQLNSILSFPTTIIIDRKGRVRRIHTGFSGPATGEHFEKWKEDFNGLIRKLLAEK